MTHLARLEAIIRADPEMMRVLSCLRDVGLPEWRVVSGCLYQTVWNVLTHRPRGTGVLDYDVIYYDAGDVSWEAEDAVIRRVAGICAGPLQIRNQARVHLWYEQRFGTEFIALRSADESLLRYPHTVGAVAARFEWDGRLDIFAPFGLDDLFAMIMRQGPSAAQRTVYEAKAARARSVWPEVTVIDWTDP